jgi:hypothetical protein
MAEEALMNHDDALRQLSNIARERAFGRHVGSDRLIQAGLDALLAGVDSPSLAMLAGLMRGQPGRLGGELGSLLRGTQPRCGRGGEAVPE